MARFLAVRLGLRAQWQSQPIGMKQWPFWLQLAVLVLVVVAIGVVVGRAFPEADLGDLVTGDLLDAESTDIYLVDSVSGPIKERWLEEPEPGGVFAVRVDNRGSEVASIEHIRPITDAGVVATYLGWSTCLKGCPGAERWTPAQRDHIAYTRDGMYPIRVASRDGSGSYQEELPSLIFSLVVKGEEGIDLLRQGCLALRSIGVRFTNGSSLLLKGSSGLVAGIELLNKPPGYDPCFPQS